MAIVLLEQDHTIFLLSRICIDLSGHSNILYVLPIYVPRQATDFSLYTYVYVPGCTGPVTT